MTQASRIDTSGQTAGRAMGRGRWIGLALIALFGLMAVLTWPATLQAEQSYSHLDPKTGYRMGHYRAALPDAAPGSTRIDAATLKQRIDDKEVILVDVNAHVGAGFDPITGEWFVQQKRFDIAGSTWLPDVGAGYLTPVMEQYFKENLERLTAGDKSKGIVLYCQTDCWMSWNASKRASSWGYGNLFWFPEGDAGWKEAGNTLVEAKPVPLTVE